MRLVGNLLTITGWQPVLPKLGNPHRVRFIKSQDLS